MENFNKNDRKQLLMDFLIAMAIALLLFRVLFGISIIRGPSMENTLHDGNIIFFRRIAYTPDYGDIVLVECDNLNEVIIKRVIGLPGDKIEIDADTACVIRNGKLLQENYLGSPTSSAVDLREPVFVEEGCVFVMGDNREKSMDSRSETVGQIPFSKILGKHIWTII